MWCGVVSEGEERRDEDVQVLLGRQRSVIGGGVAFGSPTNQWRQPTAFSIPWLSGYSIGGPYHHITIAILYYCIYIYIYILYMTDEMIDLGAQRGDGDIYVRSRFW